MNVLVRVAMGVFLLSPLACEDAGPASPDPNEGRTFHGAIAAATGGTVETTGATATVTIPPGALAQDADVTIAVAPGGSGAATSVYDLGPDGTQFSLPVTISIACDVEPADDQRVVLAWKDGGDWEPIPGSRLADGRLVGATRHFTKFSGRLVPREAVAYPWQEGQGDETAMSYWTWTDPATGLAWQMPTAVNYMNWHDAMDYCDGLHLDGGGWRLPSIDELRSLIRDCPVTATGGSCGVTEDCSEMYACWGDSGICNGCEDGGCNWDPALFYEGEPSCLPSYWSSTTYLAVIPGTGESTIESGQWAWGVMFAGGAIVFSDKSAQAGLGKLKVRCVRGTWTPPAT